MSIVKSQEGIALSKPALQYMAGLINKIANLDTNLIDDINLKTNGSFSSVHVTELIDECLQKANTYAEVLCNALTKLTAEKTTTLPILDNSEKNVIYLYSSNGSAPFEQYLKISDTELIDMGSTTISLTDYLTATEIARDYCSKVDFNTLTSEVTTVKSDVTTHVNNTDIHVTKSKTDLWDKVTDKVDKTDIVSVLDGTVTNKQLVDGKTLVDKFNSIEDNFSPV